MVFIEIPKQLTEEEKMLQQKYQKLKRKKKSLQALKAPKPEPAPAPVQIKRTSEGGPKQDPKELAKKLLRTGAISAIKAPEKKDPQGFKRSKALERKRIGADKPGGYQPFMSTHSVDGSEGSDNNSASESHSPTISRTPYQQPKFLYESSLSSKDAESIAREETNRDRRRDGKANYVNRDVPNQGNTVYVRGQGVNENLLRTGLSPFGNILNISVESEKSCGFVTFESIDEANAAIEGLNQKTVDGITLQISLARRQPHVIPQPVVPDLSATSTTNSWTAIANSFSAKGSGHKDSRRQVTYDENPFD